MSGAGQARRRLESMIGVGDIGSMGALLDDATGALQKGLDQPIMKDIG